MTMLWVLPGALIAVIIGIWAGSMLLSHTTATVIVAAVLALAIVLVVIIGKAMKPSKSV